MPLLTLEIDTAIRLLRHNGDRARLKLSSSSGYPISDRKSTRLNSSHGYISYAVFCLKKKTIPAKALANLWAAHSQRYHNPRPASCYNDRPCDIPLHHLPVPATLTRHQNDSALHFFNA